MDYSVRRGTGWFLRALAWIFLTAGLCTGGFPEIILRREKEMNIFVCIKQVPSTNQVQVDEKTGVLKRSGVAAKMNPYDLYALETALRLRSEHGGKVTVGTMGPPQAQAIIREAYMMGADEGYVFSDRKLGGADVRATSYTLSQAIRSLGDYDLILCGRQTTDGDTAQVGPAVAENLGIRHSKRKCRLKSSHYNQILLHLTHIKMLMSSSSISNLVQK